MSEGTGAPPGGEGAGEGGAPPEGSQQQGQPQGGAQQQQQGANTLAEHDDGLFDVKDGDPAWIKRLRTQGANYRNERNELRTKVAQYEEAEKNRTAQSLNAKRLEVAEAHGLVQTDDKGTKTLLPGIHLGDDPEKMEDIAKALSERLAPRQQGNGVASRRPATLSGRTSGTSADVVAGPNPAVDAIKAYMAGRTTTG